MPNSQQLPSASLVGAVRIRFAVVVALVGLLLCQAATPAFADNNGGGNGGGNNGGGHNDHDTTGNGEHKFKCGEKAAIHLKADVKDKNGKKTKEDLDFQGSCRDNHGDITYNVTKVANQKGVSGITFTVGGVDKQNKDICKAASKGGSKIKLSQYPINFIGFPPAPKFILQELNVGTGKWMSLKAPNGEHSRKIADCGLYRYVPAGTTTSTK